MKSYLIPRSISFSFLSTLIILSFCNYMSILQTEKIINIANFVVCPFRLITGIPCPGCGMTRSFFAITQGDFLNAACLNPFSFFLIFLLGISLFPDSYIVKTGPRTVKLMKSFFILVISLTLSHWLLFKLFRLL